jgi:hypothetical protein
LDGVGGEEAADDGFGFEENVGGGLGLGEGFGYGRGRGGFGGGGLDGVHGAAAGFDEGVFADGVFDAGGVGAAFLAAGESAVDVFFGDGHFHFAGAVVEVADGKGLGAFDELGEAGNEVVAFKAGVADGGFGVDAYVHEALGEAAVGVEFGGAFGHDFLVAEGAGDGGVAHGFEGEVFGGEFGFFVEGDGLGGAIGAEFFLGLAADGFEDAFDFDGFDNFDAAVVEILGFADGERADEGGSGEGGDGVVLHGEVGDGGGGVDLDAVEALDEESVGVEFGGAGGFEAFAGAGFLPDFGEGGRGAFGGADGGAGGGCEEGQGEECGGGVEVEFFHDGGKGRIRRRGRKRGFERAVDFGG